MTASSLNQLTDQKVTASCLYDNPEVAPKVTTSPCRFRFADPLNGFRHARLGGIVIPPSAPNLMVLNHKGMESTDGMDYSERPTPTSRHDRPVQASPLEHEGNR